MGELFGASHRHHTQRWGRGVPQPVQARLVMGPSQGVLHVLRLAMQPAMAAIRCGSCRWQNGTCNPPRLHRSGQDLHARCSRAMCLDLDLYGARFHSDSRLRYDHDMGCLADWQVPAGCRSSRFPARQDRSLRGPISSAQHSGRSQWPGHPLLLCAS